jgi:hypothetical protein
LGHRRALLHHGGDVGRQNGPAHHGRGVGERALAEAAACAPRRVALVTVEHARFNERLRAEQALDLRALPVDLLGYAVHADEQRRAVPAALLHRPERFSIEEIESRGQEIGGHHRAHRRPRLLEPGEARDHEPVCIRAGAELHGRLHDHPERAEGADEELGQVIARHVLDHLAPALDGGAARGDHGDADEQVTAGPVEMATRPRGVARQHAAQRGPVGLGGIQGEPLSPLAQLALERAHGDARLHRGREIAGLVLEETVHPLQHEDNPEPGRRRADAHLRAAAPRDAGRIHLRRRQSRTAATSSLEPGTATASGVRPSRT